MSHHPPVALQFAPRPAGPRRVRTPALLAATAAAALAACDSGGGASVSGPSAFADGAPEATDPAQLYRDVADAGLAGVPTGDLAEAVVGAPGATVDCAGSLPCRWVGDDAGFAVTALRVDNTGRDGRLEMHLRIDTTHDTAIGIALAGDATAGAADAAPARVTFGDDRITGTRPLAAGEPLEARVDFDAPFAAAALPAWSLLLDDNGVQRPATFANLPVGPLGGTAADCAGTLPCTWTSQDGLASIEIVGAGGFASERRLHVDFRVTLGDALDLVVGPETLAAGAGGAAFRARTQRLGAAALAIGEPVPVPAGVPMEGRIDFFRTPGSPSALETLTLDLYRDAPVPRWRPRFSNVPALAP